MRALSTTELLTAWENGLGKAPVERALTLLAAACPEMSIDTLANLALGQRDGQLLKLRESTFGSEMNCLMVCPNCSERLELNVAVPDILVEPQEAETQALSLAVEDYELEFRLPNSLDLLYLSGKADTARSPYLLLERCLLSVQLAGEQLTVEHLPTDVIDAVERRMEQADPLADIRLAVSCPSCGHQWQSVFDIVSFFWCELNAWASRILHEVYILASAFGWSERDILALTPVRRQYYLEMVSG